MGVTPGANGGNLRILLLVTGLLLSGSAYADSHYRTVAGKLTATTKPPVRVMTENELVAASQTAVALDLDANPDEIVCRKVRAGSDTASRLKVRRCKSRAEFREEDERNLALMGRELDDFNRRMATIMSSAGRQTQRVERRNRPRGGNRNN